MTEEQKKRWPELCDKAILALQELDTLREEIEAWYEVRPEAFWESEEGDDLYHYVIGMPVGDWIDALSDSAEEFDPKEPDEYTGRLIRGENNPQRRIMNE
jgi:hypothetical protein